MRTVENVVCLTMNDQVHIMTINKQSKKKKEKIEMREEKRNTKSQRKKLYIIVATEAMMVLFDTLLRAHETDDKMRYK